MAMEDLKRYYQAAHAMQTGVKFTIESAASPRPHPDCDQASPKHLRVGVNSAMVNNQAIVNLLMAKGIITADEYDKALADAMEQEAERYRQSLANHYGQNVTLI